MVKIRIPDRKYRKWNDRCQHEINSKTGKVCNRLLDEDTGECPLKHGRLLHLCKTECCSELVSGNHKYCNYHRTKKIKSICKIQRKIQKEYSRRMGWTGRFRGTPIDTYQGKIEFEIWKNKQLGFLDKIILLKQKLHLETQQ